MKLPDLTEDYSKEALEMSKAGSDAVLAKGGELGLKDQALVHNYVMATMKMFSIALAATYSAAQNREAVEGAVVMLMQATHQRIVAEIVDMQLRKGSRLSGS